MLKKYYRKVNKQEIHTKLREQYSNFCDTIIHIDWNKILYSRISFISAATHKFNDCRYLEIGCDNDICFKSIPVINKIGVDPTRGGNVRDTSDNFFKDNKISISQQTINLLVDRCKGDRENLNNELNKIDNFLKSKKKINTEDILKLTNLAENYNTSELTDNCLAKNIKKTANILNENNYSNEDCILIIRTLLSKAKRLLKLQEEIKKNKSIDQAITNFKPPIFWKDKEIVKNQILNWSLKDIEKLIYKINDTELLVKKNSLNSLNIISDFLLSNALKKTNN